MLGSLILYLRGMRIMMFQLSGFYCNELNKVPLKVHLCKGVYEDYHIGYYWGLVLGIAYKVFSPATPTSLAQWSRIQDPDYSFWERRQVGDFGFAGFE